MSTNQEHRRGFSPTTQRKSKARKIIKILTEEKDILSAGDARLLDIGTGNGEIASFLGEEFDVTSLDIEDHRQVTDGYRFVIGNEQLPFADEQFDLVVSNHIIEHVSDRKTHLNELARVLKKKGLIYIATPNRLWPWEVHHRLPLIHYLPQPIFSRILKLFGLYREEIRLTTWTGLFKELNPAYNIHLYSDKVCRSPSRYYMEVPPWCERILHMIPLKIYTMAASLHPTIILVLQKK